MSIGVTTDVQEQSQRSTWIGHIAETVVRFPTGAFLERRRSRSWLIIGVRSAAETAALAICTPVELRSGDSRAIACLSPPSQRTNIPAQTSSVAMAVISRWCSLRSFKSRCKTRCSPSRKAFSERLPSRPSMTCTSAYRHCVPYAQPQPLRRRHAVPCRMAASEDANGLSYSQRCE